MSVANDAGWSPEIAQTLPTITTTEVPAEDAALGGVGGEICDAVDEAYVWSMAAAAAEPYLPPPALWGCLEAQGSGRAGLTIPTDGVDDGMTMGSAQEGVGPATLACRMRPYVACLDLLLYM